MDNTKGIKCFIASYGTANDLNEMMDMYRAFGCADDLCILFNNNLLLNVSEIKGFFAPLWAEPGDICFFMGSSSAKEQLASLVYEFYQYGNEDYSYEDFVILMSALMNSTNVVDYCGGTIFGVARLSSLSEEEVPMDDSGLQAMVHANFEDAFFLPNPISEEAVKAVLHRDDIGFIEPVSKEPYDVLKNLMIMKNASVPDWFRNLELS